MTTIQIELCPEDRARLDAILAALQSLNGSNRPAREDGWREITPAEKETLAQCLEKMPFALEMPVEAPQKPTDGTEAPVQSNTPTQEESPVQPVQTAEQDPDELPLPAAEVKIPDRLTVKRTAVKKIQAGYRDSVKELIGKYGVEKIDAVPEEKLIAFMSELEAIGG